ncbi:OmpH family outer membrane protein [Aliiroseovarius sp. KMU-50]|uniref:OmpH family outer membrane protein n=1 Tax=Aliiroseovarius salicola TaxID=3009082 RepID=A0ABT4W557_9RHOB|nr:OmpH family outer membrane protein [Aliiroseovarius sp. KMU-50]MDA5094878.1 OmpH family outer membrane protein [Aliiroseovarius sp. KMU-50]
MSTCSGNLGAGSFLRRLTLAVTLGVASYGSGFAQEATNPTRGQQDNGTSQVGPTNNSRSPVLTVDRDRLFTGSLFGKRVLAEVEEERARLATEARKVDAALAAEEKDLTEQRKQLSSEEFRALADAFDAKVQALRNERPAQELAFTQMFEREQQSYFEKIGPILGDVVRERGGVVIVDRRVILLTTQNIDVTDEAIARIDAVLGDGTTQPD